MTDAANGNGIAVRGRIESIDVLRGLVIILMIFVNDVAGVPDAPSWLKHVSADADGMTLPDIVFPAFLFVMGMAIPIAVGRRLDAGKHWAHVAGHVALRSLYLIIIGVFMVNRPDDALIGLPSGLWRFLMFFCVLCAWHTTKSEKNWVQWVSHGVRWTAALVLVYLAFIFKGAGGAWLRPQWWGILGLIGWAYLFATGAYVICRERRLPLIGMMSLMLLFWAAYREGAFGSLPLNGGTIGAHPAIAVAGVIVGTLLRGAFLRHRDRIKWVLWFAAFMWAAGWLMRPIYGVNKVLATPSWCLWCSSITAVSWVVLYWIIDVNGVSRMFRHVRATGANALFAYLLPAVLYSLFATASIPYFSIGANAVFVGIARAFIFTIIMAVVSGAAASRGLRLKL